MLTRFDFEHRLEEVAEKFYFNPAAAMAAPRGGNSRGNEVYFGRVADDLKNKLGCQVIKLPNGECPDSGIFGDFGYRDWADLDHQSIISGSSIALEVNVPNNQVRYIQIPLDRLQLTLPIQNNIDSITLNECDHFGEFFGIEYKASKNNSSSRITVASFNSSCPCETKSYILNKVVMVHNLQTRGRKRFRHDNNLKCAEVKLKINFSMYYFIVNDEELGTRSEIRHIFLCRGNFFAPTLSQADAEGLSSEITPESLGRNPNLYRVKLRYRPFFDSRTIRANGFGLYTSWRPKIPELIREELERQALLQEVQEVQQQINAPETAPITIAPEDNVIYLDLTAERIRRRSA